MKIEIWNDSEETVDVLRLRLVPSGDSVDLHAVDGEGNRLKSLLEVWDSGIRLVHSSGGVGLPVDRTGRVELIE